MRELRSRDVAEQRSKRDSPRVQSLRKGPGRKHSKELKARVLPWMKHALDDAWREFECMEALGISLQRRTSVEPDCQAEVLDPSETNVQLFSEPSSNAIGAPLVVLSILYRWRLWATRRGLSSRSMRWDPIAVEKRPA